MLHYHAFCSETNQPLQTVLDDAYIVIVLILYHLSPVSVVNRSWLHIVIVAAAPSLALAVLPSFAPAPAPALALVALAVAA